MTESRDGGEGRLEVNPRALVVGLVGVAAIFASTWWGLGRFVGGLFTTMVCAVTWFLMNLLTGREGGYDEPSVPIELDAIGLDDARARLGAATAFDLSHDGRRVWAFVWQRSSASFHVAFYQSPPTTLCLQLVRPIHKPVGFELPRASGTPPVLLMRDRRTGVDHVFLVRDDEVSLDPAASSVPHRVSS